MIVEARVTAAVQLAVKAASSAEIDEALRALVSALGLERYAVLDLVGSRMAALYHNAPVELESQFADLARLWADPRVVAARRSPVPVVWGAEDLAEDAFYRHASGFGYRSGVAASSLDGRSSQCILMLSGSADAIADADMLSVMGFASLMAPHLMRALSACRPAPAKSPLTERERACLVLVLAGMSAKQIARELQIATRTVGQYLERARAKLGVENSYAAGICAAQQGWLDMSEVSDLASGASTGTGQA